MYEKVVYTGVVDVVFALDQEFKRGVPVPVHPRIAKKLYRNKDFQPYVEDAAPPAEEPVITAPTPGEPAPVRKGRTSRAAQNEPEAPTPDTDKE